MIYTLVTVACVFSGVAMLAALHTLVSFNKIDRSFKEWSQTLSDDCNRALDTRYSVLVDAMKKDVKAAFDAQFGLYEDLSDSQIEDLTDVERYIEENDIKINA